MYNAGSAIICSGKSSLLHLALYYSCFFLEVFSETLNTSQDGASDSFIVSVEVNCEI